MRILVSNQYEHITNKLKKSGYDSVFTQSYPFLPWQVSHHADMQFIKVNEKEAFVLKESEIIIKDYKLSYTNNISEKTYPKDCLLNCLILGKNFYANKKSIDILLYQYLTENGYSFHHINQGYAKCSTCVIDDKSVITADANIHEVLNSHGVDVLKIEHGHIILDGYDYGFIGGASGKVGDKILFTGCLNHHPDGNNIREFIHKKGYDITELTEKPLYDIGGIIEL